MLRAPLLHCMLHYNLLKIVLWCDRSGRGGGDRGRGVGGGVEKGGRGQSAKN